MGTRTSGSVGGQRKRSGSKDRHRASGLPNHVVRAGAPEYCRRCHPGAIERQCTRERVREAMRTWEKRFGKLPSSDDWSQTHARDRGGHALGRLEDGAWPPASTVSDAPGPPHVPTRSRTPQTQRGDS